MKIVPAHVLPLPTDTRRRVPVSRAAERHIQQSGGLPLRPFDPVSRQGLRVAARRMTTGSGDQLNHMCVGCPRGEVRVERLVLLHVVLVPVHYEVDPVIRQQLPHVALIGVDRRVARYGGYMEERHDAGGDVRSGKDALSEVVLRMIDGHVLARVQI